MKRIVISMIVGVMATVAAYATECPVPTSATTVTIKSAGATGSTSPLIATLKPATGKTINLTGFEITGGLGGGQASLIIAGIVGGPITYILPLSISNSQFFGTLPYAINFPCPLTGIADTNIVATLTMTNPALYSIAIHGF
jgi:hypothetical protein